MGKIEAICISKRKGEKKTPVDAAEFVTNYGIEGDAHAGAWHRQVSILSADTIAEIKNRGLPDIGHGDFAENIVASGHNLSNLGLGSRLRLGSSVELSVTQVGKVCHARCEIYQQTGDCAMPRAGIFARVLQGGRVCTGDTVAITEQIGRDIFQAVVLTISDRCARCETRDTAGPAVTAMLRETLNAHIYKTAIIPDEKERITGLLKHFSNGHSIDLIITVGGTGFSPRDVTPEAVAEVVHRQVPGFGEAMRAASLAKTPHALLSRAICGIRNSTLIISLPGSERAATENLAAVLPALDHGLEKLRGNPSDCGTPP